MNTLSELYFEKHIILTISERDCSPQERAALFCEFYRNGTKYYEDLCEALFLLSIGEAQGALYITPAGKPYITYAPKNTQDYRMFTGEELPSFRDDLYDQLNYCKQLFLKRESSSSSCVHNSSLQANLS